MAPSWASFSRSAWVPFPAPRQRGASVSRRRPRHWHVQRCAHRRPSSAYCPGSQTPCQTRGEWQGPPCPCSLQWGGVGLARREACAVVLFAQPTWQVDAALVVLGDRRKVVARCRVCGRRSVRGTGKVDIVRQDVGDAAPAVERAFPIGQPAVLAGEAIVLAPRVEPPICGRSALIAARTAG